MVVDMKHVLECSRYDVAVDAGQAPRRHAKF